MTSNAVATIGADRAEHEAWLDDILSQPNPLEPWLAAELRRGDGHLDGYSWRTDPPTDEGFGVAK